MVTLSLPPHAMELVLDAVAQSHARQAVALEEKLATGKLSGAAEANWECSIDDLDAVRNCIIEALFPVHS